MKPRHTLRLSDIEYAVSFVKNYAKDNAILLPGRIPGYKRDDVVLLPSSTTKTATAVWNLYRTAAENVPDVKSVRFFSFSTFWKQLLPHILVCKQMSDLCWICQQNSKRIMRAHNRPEEEKSEGCTLYVTIILSTLSSYLRHTNHTAACTYTPSSFSHTPSLPFPPPSISLPFPPSLSLQVLQKAEEHLLLVTQERSSYRGAVEESKRQARATFKAPDGSLHHLL